MTLVPLHQIRIHPRIRKNTGSLDALCASMKRHGLLQPILLSADYSLVAGYRRLCAAKKLQWDAIEARILPESTDLSRIEIEIDENSTRKDFTSAELAAAEDRKRKQILRDKSWWHLLWAFLRKLLGLR